ncbi:MAG: hypoxanthine phosphoribosyltransferase [Lachnospiraceae bacterium]
MSESVSVLISEEELERKIDQIAGQINRDYAGRQLHLLCILKGSMFFTCELSKHLTMPVTIDCMAVASYGNDTARSGDIALTLDLSEPIAGKHVLVIEDIVDTGYTLSFLRKMLQKRNPASLKICTLLDKPERREVPVDVDYVGFQIPNEFVVGFGLDYAQKYRNLPYIGMLEIEEGE